MAIGLDLTADLLHARLRQAIEPAEDRAWRGTASRETLCTARPEAPGPRGLRLDAARPRRVMHFHHDTGERTVQDDRGETMTRRTAKKSPIRAGARRSCAISIRGERHRSDPSFPMRGSGDLFAGRSAVDVLAAELFVSPRRPAPGPTGFSPFHGPV
jgi:hypothetical protein